MGNTKIEWATKSWNPVTGCSPISEGCEHCYARRMAKRLRGRYGYSADDPFRVTFHPERLHEPIHYRKPQMIFVCSMGDLFHKNVKRAWQIMIFEVIARVPQHTYLILTKRPARMKSFFPSSQDYEVLPNIWLGVTAETQARADERIPILLSIPATKHFISVEPMLAPMNLVKYFWHGVHPGERKWRTTPSPISWVICGSETGPGARPCEPEWIEDLHRQCQTARVPFFDKRKKDWIEREWPE